MSSLPESCLWRHAMPPATQDTPPAIADDCDVAIVGAGYTGLWTAYYLKRLAPQLSVQVFDAAHAGFGASGRNGGWLIGGLAGQEGWLTGLAPDAREETRALLYGIVDEVKAVCAREAIECDLAHSGVLYAARGDAQAHRAAAWLGDLRAAGHGEADFCWLDQSALAVRLQMAGAVGAVFSPHCATLHPFKLVQGLLAAVRRLGVAVHEHCPVLGLGDGRLRLSDGAVRARWIVPALEGASGALPELGGRVQAAQSLIIATEPLSDAQWDEIGLAGRPAFADLSRGITYGQRTADNRLLFGARGGYCFGGRARWDFDPQGEELAKRGELMRAFFPQLAGVRVSHAWGGSLGIARAFTPFALRDCVRGIASAGGFGGEGVGASNLMGRTLADLMLGRDTILTRQPWVRGEGTLASLRHWEPEPLRYLGYHAIRTSFALDDALADRPHVPSWVRCTVSAAADAMEGLMH
ncbi:NAD(P)/FAD-dependent oxidoreductase [Crenobacter intestini]|uniref:FAD-dependent oxidoreductase n=1 Tax=Crenobacter intestini TaxID=2563443 RepID=A0A4T0USZ9_9NEIS|nr:FAD-dependent oxidoreductase [Crenobacter intestini]TIC82052.1 FAD-dependent oxidoreductase [Crenobacter intestini]